jgi:uncharacterized membrane protein
MITMKLALAMALVLGLISAASAQSAWTTGTASDRERAGYESPYSNESGGGLYPYTLPSSRSNSFLPLVPLSRWMGGESKPRRSPPND